MLSLEIHKHINPFSFGIALRPSTTGIHEGFKAIVIGDILAVHDYTSVNS